MSNQAYSVLMERSFLAHQLFHKAWKENARMGVRDKETAEIANAREVFLAANDELWNKLLSPLQNRFSIDPGSAVDEVIDFLEVEIPAFRCGYLKEYFLERIKSVELTDLQNQRLTGIALQLCKNDTVRREFRRWVNLMRQVADEQFVRQVRDLLSSGNEIRAAKLMLDGVLKNREHRR